MDTTQAFASISSYEAVEQLINTGVPEDLHLEYKSGRPNDKEKFKKEIAQDISVFANSDGGSLIVGVVERDHKPVAVDGVDEKHFSRESLGQVIAYNVRPIIPGPHRTKVRISNIYADTSITIKRWRITRSRIFVGAKSPCSLWSLFRRRHGVPF